MSKTPLVDLQVNDLAVASPATVSNKLSCSSSIARSCMPCRRELGAAFDDCCVFKADVAWFTSSRFTWVTG